MQRTQALVSGCSDAPREGMEARHVTRQELIENVQRAADEPLGNHTPRRRGMPAHVAERVIDVVVAEIIARVTPVIENDWNGGEVLRRIRAAAADELPRVALAGGGNGRQNAAFGSGSTNGHGVDP